MSIPESLTTRDSGPCCLLRLWERVCSHSPASAWATLRLALILLVPGASEQALASPAKKSLFPLPARTNVILVSIDNLRPDRLGAYGEARPTSPWFDRLANQSVVFENAYATSPWTLPSHVSMFSGIHPQTHRATTSLASIGPETRLLAEILSEDGYRTLAFTGGGYVGPSFGFGRGFETYEVAWAPRRVVRATLAALEDKALTEPYFLFVHTFGVHCPFTVPPRYREQFDRRPAPDHVELKGKCWDDAREDLELTAGQIAFISDRYDAGIRRTDDELGKFFGFLEESGTLERSILVVTSDHGEEFAEHGRMGHGRALYTESLRIPLLIRIPGIPAQRIDTPVSLVDIAPTLLRALGRPAKDMEGQSLTSLMTGQKSPLSETRPVFAETDLRGESGRSVIYKGHQLIVDRAQNTRQTFDLMSDPKQERPLGPEAASIKEELTRILDNHFVERPTRAAQTAKPPPERLQQLRALGYID